MVQQVFVCVFLLHIISNLRLIGLPERVVCQADNWEGGVNRFPWWPKIHQQFFHFWFNGGGVGDKARIPPLDLT